MMTGPWWNWDPNGGPVAVDNGNGTWTFTFNPAPTARYGILVSCRWCSGRLSYANTSIWRLVLYTNYRLLVICLIDYGR